MQISSSERLRRSALAKEIKRILSAKSKQQSTFHHDSLLEEVRSASDLVSSSTVACHVTLKCVMVCSALV